VTYVREGYLCQGSMRHCVASCRSCGRAACLSLPTKVVTAGGQQATGLWMLGYGGAAVHCTALGPAAGPGAHGAKPTAELGKQSNWNVIRTVW